MNNIHHPDKPGEAPRVLGAGRMAEVLEHGDLVLKLYRPGVHKDNAFHEASVLATVEKLGLPAPRVHSVGEFHGRWGIVMSRVEGGTFGETVTAAPELMQQYLDAMAALHRRIHEAVVPGFAPLKARLGARIAAARQLTDTVRQRLLDKLAALPAGDRLCHGDFHPHNVLGEPGRATIVDWPDATCGAPVADLCRSFLLMRHHSIDLAQAYLEAYLREGSLASEEVHAWLPVVAAARLVENVTEESDELLALASGG